MRKSYGYVKVTVLAVIVLIVLWILIGSSENTESGRVTDKDISYPPILNMENPLEMRKKNFIKPTFSNSSSVSNINSNIKNEPIENMIHDKSELQKRLFEGKMDLDEIKVLMNLSENGDIEASSILLEAYVGCDFYTKDRIDNKPSMCRNIDNLGKKDKDDDLHPFFILERAALEGSSKARYEYWRALKNALAEGVINPLLDSDRWSERKSQGLYWQIGFAESGLVESNIGLAIDYYSGHILERSYEDTIYFASRALSLDPSLIYMSRLIDSATEKMENQ